MQPLLTQVWVLLGALAVEDAVTVEAVEETPDVRLPVAEVEPPRIPDRSELTTDVALATIPVPDAVDVPVLMGLVPVVIALVVFGLGTVAARIVAL